MPADWEKLKTEYVTGDIGYRALADKHGVPRSTLMKHASENEWVEARVRYKNEVVTKAVARVQARDVARLAKLQSAASSLSERIDGVFADAEQFNRHIVTEALGDGMTQVGERVFRKADARAMRDLAASIKDLTAAMRNLYGIPTVTEQASMELAKERMEIERAKADRENSSVSEVRVVFEADDGGSAEEYGG